MVMRSDAYDDYDYDAADDDDDVDGSYFCISWWQPL